MRIEMKKGFTNFGFRVRFFVIYLRLGLEFSHLTGVKGELEMSMVIFVWDYGIEIDPCVDEDVETSWLDFGIIWNYSDLRVWRVVSIARQSFGSIVSGGELECSFAQYMEKINSKLSYFEDIKISFLAIFLSFPDKAGLIEKSLSNKIQSLTAPLHPQRGKLLSKLFKQWTWLRKTFLCISISRAAPGHISGISHLQLSKDKTKVSDTNGKFPWTISK